MDWFLYDIGLRHKRVKMEGLRNIGHSMNLVLDTKKSNFRNQKWSRFYISFIMTLYYKIRPLFYYKMRERFITKYVSCFITICDSSIRNCESYHKMRRFYYKTRQLLQNALVQSSIMRCFTDVHSLLND